MCVVLGGGDWKVWVCAPTQGICMWGPEVSIRCIDCFSTLFLRNSLSLKLGAHSFTAGLSRQRTQRSCYCCHPALEIVVQCHDAWLLCEFWTSELKSPCLYNKLFPHCAIFPSPENHGGRRLSHLNPRWTSGSCVLAMGKMGSLFLVCADHCLALNALQGFYHYRGMRRSSCVERRTTSMERR